MIFLSNNISVTWSLFSCIPLYNFSYTYDYIMSTSTSFVDRSVVQSLTKCVHLSSPSHSHAHTHANTNTNYVRCMYVFPVWMNVFDLLFLPYPCWGRVIQAFIKICLVHYQISAHFVLVTLLICFWQLNGVSSFADTKEGRYNPKMDPVIPVHNWRKGSQVRILHIRFIAFGVQ